MTISEMIVALEHERELFGDVQVYTNSIEEYILCDESMWEHHTVKGGTEKVLVL